jgi:hypothetical protein
MAMSREEQDAFDRRMAGIMDPMLRPEGTAGGPVRSYSLDDIRRFLGFGNRPAMSPAEVADAAQMYERLPNPALPPTPPGGYDAPSPSIPYMPSTDPRGAAAPIPPPPRPAAPARPRLPVMAGMPSEADMQFQPARPDTFGGLSDYDLMVEGLPTQPLAANASALLRPPPAAAAPAPARNPNVSYGASRTPQQIARALEEQARRLDPQIDRAIELRSMNAGRGARTP